MSLFLNASTFIQHVELFIDPLALSFFANIRVPHLITGVKASHDWEIVLLSTGVQNRLQGSLSKLCETSSRDCFYRRVPHEANEIFCLFIHHLVPHAPGWTFRFQEASSPDSQNLAPFEHTKVPLGSILDFLRGYKKLQPGLVVHDDSTERGGRSKTHLAFLGPLV